jgi:hypothetical protein
MWSTSYKVSSILGPNVVLVNPFSSTFYVLATEIICINESQKFKNKRSELTHDVCTDPL